ncbi:MAG: hydrolase TatD [SAR86 cluster bacterium]|uniref:Hydrolase TatD n=1 Tax=SAR86 cluster bacterium TaxID=2030880 RepID=A0A2A5BBK1_9GAMM|nr:MAG: hydrolase TatD [SAR86 cluster bacterium]
MKLVDIGANLTHESFSHDLDEVISSAESAGVNHIILTGTDLESSQAAHQLGLKYPKYFSSTAGFHPHVAASLTDSNMEQIRQIASEPQVVAVGETGLDFNRNFSPKQEQLESFEQHLQLAADLQKPVFLHQRDAHDDFYRLLVKYRPKLVGGVVHCFTDSEQALMSYLDQDMYIGITGWICDERRGSSLQQMVAKIPRERLLIETDAPYLLPRTLRPRPKSRRNEPKYLPEVLNTIAQHTGRSVESIALDTYDNARRLFALP